MKYTFDGVSCLIEYIYIYIYITHFVRTVEDAPGMPLCSSGHHKYGKRDDWSVDAQRAMSAYVGIMVLIFAIGLSISIFIYLYLYLYLYIYIYIFICLVWWASIKNSDGWIEFPFSSIYVYLSIYLSAYIFIYIYTDRSTEERTFCTVRKPNKSACMQWCVARSSDKVAT